MAKKKDEVLVSETTEEVVEAPKPKEKKYTREALLASKEFTGYQRDFLSALLTEPEYTLAEARKIATAFTRKKEK